MLTMAILVLWFMGIALSLAITAFWVWMLVDCLTNMDSQGNDKIIWILVIVFTNLIGALVYYFVQRPKNQIGSWQRAANKPPM